MGRLLDRTDRVLGRLYFGALGIFLWIVALALLVDGLWILRRHWGGAFSLLGAVLFGALARHCTSRQRRISDMADDGALGP